MPFYNYNFLNLCFWQEYTHFFLLVGITPVTNEDIEWATTALIEHYLKGNVDPFDCFIAATAHRLQVPLYTRNLKHFTPLLRKLTQKPY